jgi:hypothetical protein
VSLTMKTSCVTSGSSRSGTPRWRRVCHTYPNS